MAAKHLIQELLSEYHDVRTSGLTFYGHQMTHTNQQAMYCRRNLLGRVSKRTSGSGEGKKQTKPKLCVDALSA